MLPHVRRHLQQRAEIGQFPACLPPSTRFLATRVVVRHRCALGPQPNCIRNVGPTQFAEATPYCGCD